ncbi:MAG TPA: phosphate ABC transporter permease PstA, partial [Thermoanaerobaculia bacterium]|nr:phosphate ABC transporter permease PstA [Thermoanaerobaculia bacterium]
MAGSKRKGESGGPFIWLTGAALAACLLMIVGLILVVAPRALAALWPDRLVEITLADGKKYVVAVLAREPIPAAAESAASPGSRIQVRLGNRDIYGLDFRWIPEAQVVSRRSPPDAVLVERQEYGPFQGYLRKVVVEGEDSGASNADSLRRLSPLLEEARERSRRIRRLEKREIGAINFRIEQKRLEVRAIRRDPAATAGAGQRIAAVEAEVEELEKRYEALRGHADRLRAENARAQVTLADANGEEKVLPVSAIVRIFRPNALGFGGRLKIYFSRIGEFIGAEPRESNTEGGVFPAIFGTVMMVLIMSAAVMPFGVIAALYLREYARQGALVRAVRIAVNNLAGVPSIVFGVFGLGFFVYLTGGAIDRLFYSERLPDPTFKTGGILWASLTLALLTVPVVIVATEESLAAVPRGARDGSYALGATKWQTIRRIVLPAAAPGILTGLILAMARGAGEVAPLMITGVVKLAQDLPFDANPPFLHLERKFMHLGFHIYDVGFQSPNVEAA